MVVVPAEDYGERGALRVGVGRVNDRRTAFFGLETPRRRRCGLRPGDEEFPASLDSDSVVMRHIHEGALPYEKALHYARLQVEMTAYRRQSIRPNCAKSRYLHRYAFQRSSPRSCVRRGVSRALAIQSSTVTTVDVPVAFCRVLEKPGEPRAVSPLLGGQCFHAKGAPGCGPGGPPRGPPHKPIHPP